MTIVSTVKRALLGALAVTLISSPASRLPPSEVVTASTTVDTVRDLMNRSGLSGTVVTRGEEKVGDGGAMSFQISDSMPAGKLGNISIPLADGKWAVPNHLPSKPLNNVDQPAVSDALKRAQTFADAGNDLTWDASRRSPLSGENVHRNGTKPYPITCSQFVGMVLVGWDYQHTMYVADQNTVVGRRVDFGHNPVGSRIWQANNLASWFYAHGDLWFDQNQQYVAEDVLFFSEQDPEHSNDMVRKGTRGAYFGNIYHTALYLGDGKVMHSPGPGKGVVVEKMSDYLLKTLTFVARPKWAPAGA